MDRPEFPSFPRLTPEETAAFTRRRRGRNIALLLLLLGVSVLFFAITIVKLHGPA